MRAVIAAGLLAVLLGLCGVIGCGGDDPQPDPGITIGGGPGPGAEPGPGPGPEFGPNADPATDPETDPSQKSGTAPPTVPRTDEQALEAIGATLTRDPDGTIRSISCYRNRQLTDSHLARIATFKQLSALDLRGTSLTDLGLKHVAALEGLEQLYLGGTRVTSEGLAHLGNLTNLKVLNLQDLPVDADSFTGHLGGLTSLSGLNLVGTDFDDAGLAALEGLGNLKALVLPTAITDAGLKHLAGHVQLETLVLDKSGVTDEGLANLAPLAALKRLSLRGTRVTLAGVCGLAAPRTELDIAFSQGSLTEGEMVLYRNTRNDDLVAVARLNQLKSLKLNDTAVDDAGLAHISKMFNLQQLVLPRSITDKGLPHLGTTLGTQTTRRAGPGDHRRGFEVSRESDVAGGDFGRWHSGR